MLTPNIFGAKTVSWALIVAAATMLGVSGEWGDTSKAKAQSRPAPLYINMPATFQIPPNKNVPLPIQISPQSSLPKQSMVLIRGLPPSIALTAGRAFESGVWGVKPSDLPKLRINSLGGTGLTSRLSISIVTLDGTVLAQSSLDLVVIEPSEQNTAKKAPDSQPQVKTAYTGADTNADADQNPNTGSTAEADTTPLQVSPKDKPRIAKLMKKGNEYFQIGSINIARGFYGKAADLGSKEAMVSLARTFDPTELEETSVSITVKPNVAQARKWYEKAKRRGSAKAAEYLERLPE
ncbi:MAG: hypothetical protein P8Y67_03915 [Alphaproteobacteria bacterium]